jgi:hypothetical protein
VSAALLVLSVATSGFRRQHEQLDRPSAEAPFNQPASEVLGGLEGWVESPAYVELFAPEAHRSQYRAFVSTTRLSTVLSRIISRERVRTAAAWEVEDLGAMDAFGLSGHYPRYIMAKLFAAGPVHVARGPHSTPSGFDTWMLASPYPDAALTRLSPGTLLLILRVPPL